MAKYPDSYVWRSDITKFFDSVNQDALMRIIRRKVVDERALELLQKIIFRYTQVRGGLHEKIGIPIGNLTSQVFANIYLNELDHFVSRIIKPQAYLRYGDDFLVFMKRKEDLQAARERIRLFLAGELSLKINSRNDIVVRARHGIFFLGVEIFEEGRRLKKRNWHRALTRLNGDNLASYRGLVQSHESYQKKRYFDWWALDWQENW